MGLTCSSNTDWIYDGVEKQIDHLVEKKVSWSIPVSEAIIDKARKGEFTLYLSTSKAVPRDWLPDSLGGVRVLCLAGGGGQQAPVLAAAGADVTVLDLSENMLKQDEFVAKRDGLSIKTEHGNMCDLSRLSDGSFDLIINPPSLMYVPDVAPVFRECYRVLRKGGELIVGAPNPIIFLCDFIQDDNCYRVCNKLPFKSFEHDEQGDWIEFGHTFETIIGGLTKCGFHIAGFYEDGDGDLLSSYTPTEFVTRAIRV